MAPDRFTRTFKKLAASGGQRPHRRSRDSRPSRPADAALDRPAAMLIHECEAAVVEPAAGLPSIRLAWADGGYAGKLITWARTRLRLRPKLRPEIVRRPDDLHTFQVLPRRWAVERTLAWITRRDRTIRDYERQPGHHETYVYWAMIIVMTRRLARQPATTQPQAA